MNPTMCNELGVAVNTTYRWRDHLLELGWIVLVKEGTRHEDGTQEPHTYRVLEHEDFIKARPDSCPPGDTAPYDVNTKDAVRELRRFSTDDTGRSFRFLGNNRPARLASQVLDEWMAHLTEEQRNEITEHWKSIEPDPNDRPAPHKLPLSRHREPQPATSVEVAGRYLQTDSPLPTDGVAATYTREDRYLPTDLPLPTGREEPSNTPVTTPVNTPATPPPTPSTAMMPLWLFRLWDKEKQSPLNLRPKHMDEIVALLRDDRAHEFGKWDWLTGDVDYAQRFATWEVMLEGAWFEFVTAKPEPWPEDFQYPIRSFLDNSLSYILRIQDRVKTKDVWRNYAAERVNDHSAKPDRIKSAVQVIDRCDGWHAKHGYSDN